MSVCELMHLVQQCILLFEKRQITMDPSGLPLIVQTSVHKSHHVQPEWRQMQLSRTIN
jgi:hypothetical protein